MARRPSLLGRLRRRPAVEPDPPADPWSFPPEAPEPQPTPEPEAAPEPQPDPEPEPDPPEPPPAVSARDLVKVFGEGDAAVIALRGVELEIEPGTFTVVVGPSGSGKSTLLHLLAGLDAPTEGEVHIAGIPLAGLGDRRLTRLRRERVGFVFQSFNLMPTLTAAENVGLPVELAGREADPAHIAALLDAVGLADRAGHRPDQLSGGQQQRLAIARALAMDPAVVFADEPTGNLDSATGQGVLELLRAAVDDRGQTVVMVTHDPAAGALADRTVALEDGRVVADRRTERHLHAGAGARPGRRPGA